MTTAWGVTPHAQNTGTSPSLISTGSPNSGLLISLMPMAEGSPICTGAPCTAGKRPVQRAALTTCECFTGLMLTTVGPLRRPAGWQLMLVIYIGTLHPQSMCLIGIPASIRAPSNENEHPIRNATRSALQYFKTSVGSSFSSPFSHTRYLGISVLTSDPGAISLASPSPGSVTSSMGHGLGLRCAKTRKSYAQSFGRTIIFAWTCERDSPEVGCVHSPFRISSLISLGDVQRNGVMSNGSVILERPPSNL